MRSELRDALRAVLPGTEVRVYGSLTSAGRFTETSDVDLALETEPADMSICQLIGRRSEVLRRRVDVVLLSKTRLRDKILHEGETWTP